jgi:hypothetical protein
MTITVNTRAYAFDTNPTTDVGRHLGPSHTFAAKDYLDLRRTAPKKNGDFRGMARSGFKFVRTATLDDGSTADAIVEVNFSIPVGMADGDISTLIDDTGDLCLLSNASDLVKKHDITQ